MPPPLVDPLSSRNFRVEIAGISATAFLEVSGLEMDVEVLDIRAGGDKSAARKIPGEVKYSNLVLKRGFTKDLSLWNWIQERMHGDVSRRDLSVILLNDSGEEVLRFNARGAWPVKWSASEFQAEGNELALEILEITHEGLSVGV